VIMIASHEPVVHKVLGRRLKKGPGLVNRTPTSQMIHEKERTTSDRSRCTTNTVRAATR
jgi:hypothetical protein